MYNYKTAGTVQCLVELLDDDHTQVRLHGVRKLAQMGSGARPAVPALCHAARDRSHKVRRAAVEALEQVTSRPATRKESFLSIILRALSAWAA